MRARTAMPMAGAVPSQRPNARGVMDAGESGWPTALLGSEIAPDQRLVVLAGRWPRRTRHRDLHRGGCRIDVQRMIDASLAHAPS